MGLLRQVALQIEAQRFFLNALATTRQCSLTIGEGVTSTVESLAQIDLLLLT